MRIENGRGRDHLLSDVVVFRDLPRLIYRQIRHHQFTGKLPRPAQPERQRVTPLSTLKVGAVTHHISLAVGSLPLSHLKV